MMKFFLFAVLLFPSFLGYSQDTLQLKTPTSFTIGSDNGNLYCLQQTIDLEVAEWAYDSCNFYQNRFVVSFEILNSTKENLICPNGYIVWYDVGSLRSWGYESVTILPGKSTTCYIEVIPYSKWRMNAPGEIIVKTATNELRIPAKIKFTRTSTKCCCPKKE